MTAETVTRTFTEPLAEETLAELPFSRYLWDGSPVRAATEAEAAEYARRLTQPGVAAAVLPRARLRRSCRR